MANLLVRTLASISTESGAWQILPAPLYVLSTFDNHNQEGTVMRVKVLIMLAIAGLILACSAGIALADTLPGITGLPSGFDLESLMSSPSASGVNNLGNSGSSYGYPVLGTGQTSTTTPELMNWLNSSDSSSPPGLAGYVPEDMMSGSSANYGVDDLMSMTAGTPTGTADESGWTIPSMGGIGSGFDTSMNSLLSQLSF